MPQPNASSTTPSVSEWLGHSSRAEHSEGTDLGGNGGAARLGSLFAVNSGQPHNPLSPQSSITSSGSGGSDAHQDDLYRTCSAGGTGKDLAMKGMLSLLSFVYQIFGAMLFASAKQCDFMLSILLKVIYLVM